MDPRTQLETAGGSVAGRAHVQAGRNNQDAFCWQASGAALVALVCDGCSSGPRSELGAWLGCRLLTASLLERVEAGATVEDALEQARLDVLGHLAPLARAMGGSFSRTVGDALLFTVIGAVVTPTATTAFAMGDGLVAINGERIQLAFPGNAPPYLAYWLLPDAPRPRFEILKELQTEELRSLLLGTDGVADLDAAADRPLPGRSELVGPLEQFWTEDRFFSNPDMVRRRLVLANRESFEPARVPAREPGLLHDDTTLVVVRRPRRAP